MKQNLSTKLLRQPYIVWSVLFILAPLAMVCYYAFTDKSGAFSLNSISQIPSYLSAFGKSILYGAVATVICFFLSYPFAYALSKAKLSAQKTMVMLVMLPMWMNFLIRTYSWMTILGRSGLLNKFLSLFGVESIKFLGTPGAVILGMVYNFLPYMILPIYSVLSKLDNSLIEAAKDLGCNRLQVFKRVVFPLSVPGILSGVTMVFVPCVSTFYITQKLGNGQIMLIGDIIEMQFQQANNYNLGAALSLVLMVLILICIGVMNRFGSSEENGGALYI